MSNLKRRSGVTFFQPPFQHKCQEIRECVELSVPADIPAAELYTVLDVAKIRLIYQLIERGSAAVISLDLNGNKGILVTHEEIHLYRAFFVPEEVQRIALLIQHICNNVLIDSTFVGVEILVSAQIVLHFVVERAYEQSGIPEVQFEVVGIKVAAEG